MINGFDMAMMISLKDPQLWLCLLVSHTIVFIAAFALAAMLNIAADRRLESSLLLRAEQELRAEAIELSDWLNFNGGDDDEELCAKAARISALAEEIRQKTKRSL